ncbi:MAG: EEP domain-containing protein, partial [Mesorhizobium sp.]
MKLISYNIQYGYGSDGRYDLSRAARLVDGADIIALQEVERHWLRTNEDDQPEILSRLLPGYYWAYGPAFDLDASEKRDGRVVNRRRQFGTMVLSKLPIVWSRLHALPMRRTLRPLNTRNAALECMIRTPAGPVRVLSLHLAHIAAEERLEQIDYLNAEHRRAPSDG